MTKRPPITVKERVFVKELMKSGNATEAASVAYDVKSRSVAKVIGSQNLTKLNFPDLLEHFGVTDDLLAMVLKDALEATRIIQANIYVNYKNGERMTDHIRTEDWNTRLKALLIALRLKNKLEVPSETSNPTPILGGLSVFKVMRGDEDQALTHDIASTQTEDITPV